MLIPVLHKYRPMGTIRKYVVLSFIVLPLLLGTAVHCSAESGTDIISRDVFSVPGWKVGGETYRYSPSNLYEYINGGAYFFIGYGFVELTGANFSPDTGESDAVTVDIYDMGVKLNAFGVYQLRKDSQAHVLNIGTASFGASDYLVFHKDRYYVEIRAFFADEKDQNVLEKIASSLAKRLPGDTSLPDELAYLPEKDRVMGSERFIRGGILGHEFLDQGLVGEYQIKGNKITAFIAFLPSVQEAVSAVEKHKAFLSQSEKKWLPIEGFGKHSFVSEEPYHQTIMVTQQGTHVAGIYDLKDIAVGKTLLADILRRLK